MKANKLVVIMSIKNGDCFQVALSEYQTEAVTRLISQFHDGKIKVYREKLEMTIGEKP